MSRSEEEIAQRIIVWKNLRIMMKTTPEPDTKAKPALLVLANAEKSANE
jgi:hypothetical protein